MASTAQHKMVNLALPEAAFSAGPGSLSGNALDESKQCQVCQQHILRDCQSRRLVVTGASALLLTSPCGTNCPLSSRSQAGPDPLPGSQNCSARDQVLHCRMNQSPASLAISNNCCSALGYASCCRSFIPLPLFQLASLFIALDFWFSGSKLVGILSLPSQSHIPKCLDLQQDCSAYWLL